MTAAASPPSPWHEGEVRLHRSLGIAERMEEVGRKVLRPFLIEQHRAFFPLLPFLVVGALDKDGDPWATMVTGHPGFVWSPEPRTLAVEAPRDPNDPADAGLENGAPVGLLGIDLATRRRNRLNGTLQRSQGNRFTVSVHQSFGNCPRYIRPRAVSVVRNPAQAVPVPAIRSDRLDATARRIIGTADTFFVASRAADQVDVSHRGGPAGFVRMDPDGGLTVPDYAGNMFFNTLGNFLIDPRAGLLFFDPASGDTLQITGAVTLILERPEVAAFPGAERIWRLMPRVIIYRSKAVALRWTDFPEQ